MDHQIKMMIVDAITNVVNSAPKMQNYNLSIGVSAESFNIWMNYVDSVLQTSSKQVNMNLILAVNNQIKNIVMQNNDYTTKTYKICDVLLNFAKNILYL